VAGADPSATGVQNVPGFDYNTESGLILPASAGLPGAGLADFGTRFKAVFRNIPSGVSLFVSTQNLEATNQSSAQLVTSESGTYIALPATITVSGTNAAQIPVVGGTATAVWEVTATSPVLTEQFTFAVYFDSTGPLDLKTAAATVNVSYAPTVFPGNGTIAQPASFPVPRFADTSTTQTVLSVSACQTALLFPYVVTQNGFDTGIAISNTSQDPIGTTTQSGACVLTAYGNVIPPPVTTPVLAAGTDYALLASSVFPDFKGYVFAVCNFQFGHAFSFISDVGARNLAMGYLALVVQSNSPVTRPNATVTETLVH